MRSLRLLRRAAPLLAGPQQLTPALGRARWLCEKAAPSAAAASSRLRANSGEETYSFESDTRKVLDIVTHSLYSEREIFLRELVSNATDALEKHRLTSLAASADPGKLEVRVTTDELGRTLTLEDSGCGFTREALVEQLGTIARSGTAAFSAPGGSSLIGKFGVGFYSAFMVADRVELFTRAAGGEPLVWRSSGGDSYTIAAASPDQTPARGTRVLLHLKSDAAASELSTREGVARVLRKHSSFLPHPLLLDGEVVNNAPALWAQPARDVSEAQHAAFYDSLPGSRGRPAFHLHYSTDAPLEMQVLLYIPSVADSELLNERKPDESGVALYCRRVLIQPSARGLLPDYLRFVRGVVDCSDVPLNIGREALQDASVVRRLNAALSARVLKFLLDMAKKKPREYEAWFSSAGGAFIKEGVCAEGDAKRKVNLAKLLRYESTAQPAGSYTSLEAVAARAAARAGEAAPLPPLYYAVGHSRAAAEASPYMEAFKSRGLEVLLMYRPSDEIVMRMLGSFEGHACVNVEEADVSSLPAAAAEPAAPDQPAAASLSEAQMAELVGWLGGVLKDKVSAVRASARLSDSPALLTGHMPESLRRLQEAAAARGDGGQTAQAAQLYRPLGSLELNPRHPLVVRLAAAARDPGQKEVAELVAEQTLDLARLAAGAVDDPRSLMTRLTRLCQAALGPEAAGAAAVAGPPEPSPKVTEG